MGKNSALGVNQPISWNMLHELYRESCIEFTLEALSFKVYIYDSDTLSYNTKERACGRVFREENYGGNLNQ